MRIAAAAATGCCIVTCDVATAPDDVVSDAEDDDDDDDVDDDDVNGLSKDNIALGDATLERCSRGFRVCKNGVLCDKLWGKLCFVNFS